MKSNSLTLLALPFLSLGFLAGSAAAESAREIALKHEQEKATEIAAYLEKNPDAEDKDEARALLITAYRATGQSDKAAVLLRARYDELPKGVDAPLEVMIGEVVHPLIEALQKVGDKEGALAFIETVKTDLKPHPASGQINQFLDQFAGMLNLPGVGEVIEIAGETTKGHPYDLAEMKGKVVLVDFWATWCGPCVGEIPNVLSAHKKFNEKGFEVVGVSLDEDPGALESFVTERGLPWPQILNSKAGLAEKYGIAAIPATFLIGKDGKIVATNLRGEELERTLAKIFAE